MLSKEGVIMQQLNALCHASPNRPRRNQKQNEISDIENLKELQGLMGGEAADSEEAPAGLAVGGGAGPSHTSLTERKQATNGLAAVSGQGTAAATAGAGSGDKSH